MFEAYNNQWTLGPTIGIQTVIVRLHKAPSVSFTIYGRAFPTGLQEVRLTPPSPFALVPGQSFGPPKVLVTTAAGDPYPGVPVTFGCYETAPTGIHTQTDAQGMAQATCTAPAGAGRYQASVFSPAVDTGLPAQWSYTVAPGPAAALQIANGNGQVGSAGQPLGIPLAVVVRDQYGNWRTGDVVVWTPASGSGSASPTSSVSGNQGASTVWTLGPTAGTQTLTASLSSVPGASVTFTATASP